MAPRHRSLDRKAGPAGAGPGASGHQAHRPLSRRVWLARLAIHSAAASAATLALLGAVAPNETAVVASPAADEPAAVTAPAPEGVPTSVVVDHDRA
jgi:hypothetical protein